MSEPGWYERGRAALANWAAASRAGTWGSKESPLGRALNCVDAGDALAEAVERVLDCEKRHPDRIECCYAMGIMARDALAAYQKARSAR